MYNIITERNLREALESIPAQYTVDMEKHFTHSQEVLINPLMRLCVMLCKKQ